jgi:hypothetical protein
MVEHDHLEKNRILQQLVQEAENAKEADIEAIQQQILNLEAQAKEQIRQIKEYEKETLKAYNATR